MTSQQISVVRLYLISRMRVDRIHSQKGGFIRQNQLSRAWFSPVVSAKERERTQG